MAELLEWMEKQLRLARNRVAHEEQAPVLRPAAAPIWHGMVTCENTERGKRGRVRVRQGEPGRSAGAKDRENPQEVGVGVTKISTIATAQADRSEVISVGRANACS